MDQKETDTLNGKGETEGQTLRPFLVIITPDDIQGGEGLQFVHNGLGVDITAMDNSIRLGEVVQHLRAEQAVGVREDNDAFHIRIPSQWSISFWMICAVQPAIV